MIMAQANSKDTYRLYLWLSQIMLIDLLQTSQSPSIFFFRGSPEFDRLGYCLARYRSLWTYIKTDVSAAPRSINVSLILFMLARYM